MRICRVCPVQLSLALNCSQFDCNVFVTFCFCSVLLNLACVIACKFLWVGLNYIVWLESGDHDEHWTVADGFVDTLQLIMLLRINTNNRRYIVKLSMYCRDYVCENAEFLLYAKALFICYTHLISRPPCFSLCNCTQNHTKCHFILDYSFRVSWCLFYNSCTGNRSEYSTIYLLSVLKRFMASCITSQCSHIMEVYFSLNETFSVLNVKFCSKK